jgi:hypothetical protein
MVVSEAFLNCHNLLRSFFATLQLIYCRNIIVGTRKAIPVNFPFNSGITFPTAFAAPVEDGIILQAARPPLQSLEDHQ